MIVYKDVVQNSPEWACLRAGIPTASQFKRIMTPGGKKSTSDEGYMYELLAERMLGRPLDEYFTRSMQRGSELEPEARKFYQLQRECDTVKVGFVTNDDGTVGASPDSFVNENGLLEIKCPDEGTHVSYLFTKAVEKTYYPQVQGQLWICEREWLDILSYHPELPPALIRVERDDRYIAELSKMVMEFSRMLEDHALDLIDRGWLAKPEKPREYSTVQIMREALREIEVQRNL